MASSLLDLSFLTKEERKLLEKVVKADEDLRLKDRIRLGTLRQKYEVGKHHQESVPSSQCACCDASLSGFRKKGAPCPSCGHMTCSNCRHKPHTKQHQFICTVCENKWMLDIQAKKYNDEEPPSLFRQLSRSTSPSKSPQSMTAGEVPPSEDRQLHGSDLIKRSLTVRNKTRAKVSSSPEEEDKSTVTQNDTKVKTTDTSINEGYRAQAKRLPSCDTNSDSDTDRPSPLRESCGNAKLQSDVQISSDIFDKSSPERIKLSSPSDKDRRSELETVGEASISPSVNPEQVEEPEDPLPINEGLQDKATKPKASHGKILVGFKQDNDHLIVNVLEGSGLPSRKDGRPPYAYVVVLLLPDKQSNKSTIQSPTNNPVFNEVFSYNLCQRKVGEKSLLVKVMDHVRKEKIEDSILGQVIIHLSSVNQVESKPQWFNLNKDVDQIHLDNFTVERSHSSIEDTSSSGKQEAITSMKVNSDYTKDSTKNLSSHLCGKLSVNLKFDPQSKTKEEGDLIVEVQKAELSQKTSCFVALRLLPKGRRTDKKTRMKNEMLPIWNESFKFEQVSLTDLKSSHVLDIAVIDWNSNTAIGRFQFGAVANPESNHMRGIEEVQHWEEMLSKPGSAVDRWHELLASTKHTEPAECEPHSEPQHRSKSSPTDGDFEGIEDRASVSPKKVVSHSQRYEGMHESSKRNSLLSLASSRESIISNLSITGEVMFGVWYKEERLYVHIVSAANLGLSSESSCNPYIKTYLLPDKDKKTKKKTVVKKNTQEPEYGSTLTYLVKEKEVQSRTLCLSVWDKGTLKRNHFMGEVRLPLTTLDLNDSTDRWYALGEKASDNDFGSPVITAYSGNIYLGIMFEPSPSTNQSQDGGVLLVKVRKASELSAKSSSKLKKVSVGCTLLPSVDSDKRITSKLGKGNSPAWEESFVFNNVTLHQLLGERVLEIVVYERKEMLGCIRLGGYPGRAAVHQPWMDATDLEASSWEKMLRDHGRWVNECYPLRPSLTPRQVNLSIPPPVFDASVSSLIKASSLDPRSMSEKSGVESTQGSKNEATQVATVSNAEEVKLTAERGDNLKVFSEVKEASASDPVHPAVESKNTVLLVKDNTSNEPSPLDKEGTASTKDKSKRLEEELPELKQSADLHSVENTIDVSRNTGATRLESEEVTGLLKDTPQTASSADTPPIKLNDVPSEGTPNSFKDIPSEGSPPINLKDVPTEDTPPINLEDVPPFEDTPINLEDVPPSEDTPPINLKDVPPSEDTPPINLKDLPYEDTPSVSLKGSLPIGVEGKPATDPIPISLKDTAFIVGRASHASEEESSPPPRGVDPFVSLSGRTSVSSFGSMASVYSAAGGKGNYDIIGEVLLGVFYRENHLCIHVNRARGLAAANKNGLSDPYVKTYLLPDKRKQTKKKTGIKRKTLNPVYNETITYSISEKKLSPCTLWLSVWDWDRFGRNQFLGEVRIPLSSVDLSDMSDHWHPLAENNDEQQTAIYRGEITLSLKVESTVSKKGKSHYTLHVHIGRATDLYHTESKAMADSFVKCFLLPDKSSSGKRKTGVIKNNNNPVWDEKYTYEKLSLDDLTSRRVLEVAVWDYSKNSSSEFIGGLRLGPGPADVPSRNEWMDSIGDEVKHWDEAVAKTGEWVQYSHTLRSTMDYRNLKMD